MTKSRTSNCDKTQQLKLWQNSKTWIMKKLKNSYCYKTQKPKFWQNSKTQILTKLKLWQKNIYIYKGKKTQIVTKTQKLEQNSENNGDKSNCAKLQKNYFEKTQKPKLWQ